MPYTLPSPSGGANPWGQLTQVRPNTMMRDGLQFISGNMDRQQLAVDNEGQRELQLRQALIQNSPNMTGMGNDPSAMLAGMSGQAGVPYQYNIPAATGHDVNAIEAGRAENALKFGTAQAKTVEGGAVPYATPYATHGNIPAAALVRRAGVKSDGRSRKGGVKAVYGLTGNSRSNSGQLTVEAEDAEELAVLNSGFPVRNSPMKPARSKGKPEAARPAEPELPIAYEYQQQDFADMAAFEKAYSLPEGSATIELSDSGEKIYVGVTADGQPIRTYME